ncbi:hypothetical protein J2X66_000371 [Pseudomonas sp. 3296]|uniref:hypothetical protein n=1 Tax=Pseudomonas sp. 3296 TaxID=2817753 RepID=UPI0028637759|nr:hypothetical protein [Pseudomonas sp. 3296]MDR6913524.1 hypothetical protein [Pseudomonas sp. 3296]
MTLSIKRQCGRHLAALFETGKHYSVYMVGPKVHLRNFTKFLPRFLKQRMGNRPKYHIFWFATTEGLCVAISANIAVRRIIDNFYQEAVKLKYVEGAYQLYIGGNKTKLTTTLAALMLEYQSQAGIRTLGGSVVSATADQTAARMLVQQGNPL